GTKHRGAGRTGRVRPATVEPAQAGLPPARFAYKWIALSNTTIGMLMATVNATSILIAMPVIFRGININPLDPANFSYLLWLRMGYMVVSAVLVVTAGRLGDGAVTTSNCRWIFRTNVPIGLIGSVWGFWQLREIGVRHRARIDWIGNVTFAAGLAMVRIGVTSGLQPYGGSAMGWGNPSVI